MAAYLAGCAPTPPLVVQPLAFSHRVHHEQDLGCTDCHVRAEEDVHATLPSLASCMQCHAEPQGESPDEPRVREYAQRGEPIPWAQVNRVDGHVYFSHGVHAKLAGMSCAECHGDMTLLDEPLTRPNVTHLDMDACRDCHDERRGETDCLACHK